MDVEAIQGVVQKAYEQNTPLNIVGGGSKAFFGREAAGKAVCVTGYQGIVEHDPAELVVTVRSGTLISDLEKALAEHNQCLPFEPPRFSATATVGGMVAAGLSGPRRPWAGSVRDFVLGVVMVNGLGEVLRFGGRVMKNVAGYDASRLMVGAMGSFGILTEVSFKVLPTAPVHNTRVFEFSESAAIDYATTLGQSPLPVSGCCHVDGKLYVRLSGSEQGVSSAVSLLAGGALPDEAEFWDSVRDQGHDFFQQSEAPLWRVSLPASSASLDSTRHAFVEWGGAERWYRGDAESMARIVEQVDKLSGHVSLFRGGERHGEVNAPLAKGVFALHQRLKHAFDPRGVLNPGRLYKDL
jgi:glycolate oxidase FAD binding subunit